MKPPFPYFGGKARIAHIVWERFGDVPNFVDPFFGSNAVLLARPRWHEKKIETINDANCLVANFYRAVRADPDQTAFWADRPVNEADLHAIHQWLIQRCVTDLAWRERVMSDPDFYDAKVAGWWVWGMCCWLGGGWCFTYAIRKDGIPTRERPHLGGMFGTGERGIISLRRWGGIYEYFRALSERLKYVRVCCGDWSRVVGKAVTTTHGTTGVFLDPPYSAAIERDDGVYGDYDDPHVAVEVCKWCVENGNDPLLRIALCGYRGEGHEVLEDTGWTRYDWVAQGGYAHIGNNRGKSNRLRESIWFSPHCLTSQLNLFSKAGLEGQRKGVEGEINSTKEATS